MSFCDVFLGIEDRTYARGIKIHISLEIEYDILMPLVKLSNDEFF